MKRSDLFIDHELVNDSLHEVRIALVVRASRSYDPSLPRDTIDVAKVQENSAIAEIEQVVYGHARNALVDLHSEILEACPGPVADLWRIHDAINRYHKHLSIQPE